MSIVVRSVLTATVLATLCGSPLRVCAAAMTVFGNGLAQICADAARDVSHGRPLLARTVTACDQALGDEVLTPHDLAGTHINRGVILLARSKYEAAKADFDAAAALMPEIGEIYTDRGAALIGLHRYAEGIAEINHGLTFNPDEPEKAYFNRALADEALDDMKAAYFDYLRASQLNPKWPEPLIQLARFTVAKASS